MIAPTEAGGMLALTLGHRLGWALLSTAGTITSGRANLPPYDAQRPGLRFLRLRGWLTQTKNAAGSLRAVIFDEQTGAQPLAEAHHFGGMVATVTAWAEHHRIGYEAAPSGLWVRAITAQPDASPGELIAALRSIGHSASSADGARALAMLLWRVTL
jgi:hypothetical protein